MTRNWTLIVQWAFLSSSVYLITHLTLATTLTVPILMKGNPREHTRGSTCSNFWRDIWSSGPALGECKQLYQVGPPKGMGLKKQQPNTHAPHWNKKKKHIYVPCFSFFSTRLSFFLSLNTSFSLNFFFFVSCLEVNLVLIF